MPNNENTDIALIDGDISITPSGDLLLIRGDSEIVQTAINNIYTIYGEIWNDKTRGNMAYNRRIKLNTSGLRQIEADCQAAILQDSRVSSVPYIRASTTATPSECMVEFSIKKPNGDVIRNTVLVNIVEG